MFEHTLILEIAPASIDSLLTSDGMDKSLPKAAVTSGKDFQVIQAVFFPLSVKLDTVSQPEKA